MKCPVCTENLRSIPPCFGEWICINDNCPLSAQLREVYGSTQKEVTDFVKRMYKEYYENRKKYRKGV